MIEGWLPQVFLAVHVVGAAWCLVMVVTTPWRATPVGQWLAAFCAVTFLWWSLIGVGTWLVHGYPVALQGAQSIGFALDAVVITWCAALMTLARFRPLARHKAPTE